VCGAVLILRFEVTSTVGNFDKGERVTLKMLRRKSKTQLEHQDRNTQNSIALLNYLKRIAPQQLMLRTQVFTKKIFKRKNAIANFKSKLITIYK
jgi:hypothetical protein